MSDLPYIKRPCDECPWRADAVPGRFTEERWTCLLETSDTGDGTAPMGAPLFACHKTSEGGERVCAGWLAQEGGGSVPVRFAVIAGQLPASALQPGPGWPKLHESIHAAAEHDLGYSLE